jgi:predicted phosphoribosyltransferase
MKFKNFEDAADQLTTKLETYLDLNQPWLALGIGEFGISIAQRIAVNLNLTAAKIQINQTQDEYGYRVIESISVPHFLETSLVICDVGVETGTMAQLVAAELAKLNQNFDTCFAAPVIPREAQAELKSSYNWVISLKSPMIRRALHWEYQQFS